MKTLRKTTTATALLLLTTLLRFPLHAQAQLAKPVKTPAQPNTILEKDGPASAELRAMLKGDQEDRAWYLKQQHPSPEERARFVSADTKRLARARVFLQQNKFVTSEDFENAALLFQHGETPDDFLVSHELSVIALLKAKRNTASNGTVLAEGRFLERIGHKQRFGSQSKMQTDARSGKISLQLSDIDEEGDFAVTDALRADLFMPPLSFSKAQPLTPTPEVIAPIIARLKQRYNLAWQKEQSTRPEAQELQQLAALSATDARVKRVLTLYRTDNLRPPADYAHAASVLLNAIKATPATQANREKLSRQLLLAHELATVATVRKHPSGPELFAQTWDRFLVAVGQPQRYGTYTEQCGSRATYVGGFSGSTNRTVQVFFAQKHRFLF